jgi:hypothetical protein
MLELKQARARAIVEVVFAMNEACGVRCASPGSSETRSRLVDPKHEPWSARITPDRRMTVGRLYGNVVGNRVLEAEGVQMIEVLFQNELRLVVNLGPDGLEIHYYKPGLWEAWFGVDPGSDTYTYCRLPFADPKSPAWRELENTADFQLPPLRGDAVHKDKGTR